MSDPVKTETPRPGIYEHIPFDDYIKIPAMSKSTLFPADTSPLHYQHTIIERAKEDPVEVAAHFALGRAIHTSVLEPDLFDDNFVVAPVINKRTNKGKEEWANYVLQAQLEKKGILTDAQYEQCMGMGQSVHNHRRAQEILAGGKAEVTVIDYDPVHDIYKKCRLDWFVDDEIIIDLKSISRSAGENAVIKQIFDLGYYVQGASYLDITSSQLGKKLKQFVFIFVESKPPYAVGIYVMGQEMRRLGERKYSQLMDKIMRCAEKNYWPHYNDDAIVELEFKPWMTYEITRDMG